MLKQTLKMKHLLLRTACQHRRISPVSQKEMKKRKKKPMQKQMIKKKMMVRQTMKRKHLWLRKVSQL